MNLLLDTHVFIWATIDQDSLSEAVKRILQQTDNELYYSPIMIWEVLILAEKKRIAISGPTNAVIRQGIHDLALNELPLNTDIAFLSREVSLPHHDPADRFLVATARYYKMPLLTADNAILSTGSCKTINAVK